MDFSRLRASTIPGLLVERARARPARVAFRAKVLDDAPGVRGVIVVETSALFMYRSTRVHRFADIEAAGRALAPVDALARLAAGVRPDDAATIVYTSGTTGHPKGALYRHGQHLAACANILAHYPI